MSVVYFIGAGRDNNPIKIGYADDLGTRLTQIQTSHWLRLNVLATVAGGADLESRYHDQFKHLHVRGEWFWRTSDIDDEIARLNGRVAAVRATDNISLLAAWIDDADLTAKEAAQRFGISESALSLLLAGKRGIGFKTATSIEKVTGGAVRVDRWLTSKAA